MTISIDFSAVIPLYNESAGLPELYDRLSAVLRALSSAYEIIFVDDGSIDGSVKVLRSLQKNDAHVRVFQLKKNYGKSQALACGFRQARGDIVITLDADLQDLPEEIPHVVDALNNGYDIVSGWRHRRADILLKRWASAIFNLFVGFLTKVRLHDCNCCLKAYRREALNHLSLYGEMHRFIPILLAWKGFQVGEIKIDHAARKHGRSKFGVYRYLAGFLDLLTVFFLSRYRHKPLHLFGCIGLGLLALGGAVNLFFLLQWLSGCPMRVRPLMVFGWVLLIMGIQFISIGLISELIASTIGKDEEVIVEEHTCDLVS